MKRPEAPAARPELDDATIELAIRLLLGRPPRDAAEVVALRGHRSAATLRITLMRNPEFLAGLPQRAGRLPAGEPARFALPLVLLTPPEDPVTPWRFVEPDLRDPVTQLCTAGQFGEPDYGRWCAALGEAPRPHRKQWEFVWLLASLEKAGLLRPGLRGLGFGSGREKLPALFAHYGIDVVASDTLPEQAMASGWAEGAQHAASLADLFDPGVVSEAAFARHASFRPVDMNAIPPDLAGFDFCWSICALEHLGSLRHGLGFIEASLATLRPGGMALHTTEFNLSSDFETLETPGLSLFRRRDILALAERLVQAGHRVWPVNLHPGHRPLDTHVDVPPYSMPHLKIAAEGWVATSIGIAVQRSSVA